MLTMYSPSPTRENSPDPVQYVLLSNEVGVSVSKIVPTGRRWQCCRWG